MNKKSISGIIAVILMIAAVAYAGFTNNTDKPVETQNTASQSYIEGETYTYNVPGETDFTSGETYSFRYESYLDELPYGVVVDILNTFEEIIFAYDEETYNVDEEGNLIGDSNE